jgi:serine/threonine protein kinase/tetratricopeptide (TPR) repeat protein
MSQRLDNGVEDASVRDAWDSPPAQDFAAMRSLKRELMQELRAGAADPVTPEDLLSRWPADPHTDPDVASLLLEDFLQRRLRGEEPSVREYEQRFPEHRDSLRRLFENQAVLRSVGGASNPSDFSLALPAVGDSLFHFRLVGELGRGAFARVFLAEEADLAGRHVVLKVSAISGSEPQTLAQLQHTHIVPIYSVHEDARAGLRAVCMPYFGGASFSQVLRVLWEQGKPPEQGEQLVEALEALGPDSAAAERKEPPALQLFRETSYLRSVVWIVARLAEALQHAHQRGILHRDIKPSNILLSAEGQPMLLDFNLAQSLTGELAQASATLGGTVAYMAPEHLRAMFSRDATLARLVDHRADVYSLGMVLYEALVGQGPFQQSGSYSLLPVVIEAMALERSQRVPSLRERRPDLPWGLESILRKCLAPLPSRRYQQAQHLAEDLDAFLNDAPLRHAPELSQLERLRKWIRRHPRLTSSGSVAAAAVLLLFGAGAALVGVHRHLETARAQLERVEARQRKENFDAGAIRALCLANTAPEQTDPPAPALSDADHLRRGMEACEQALGLYGVLEDADWQQRRDWQRLEPGERQRLAEDVRELLLLLAAARLEAWHRDRALVPSAATRAEVLQQALDLLARAERLADLPPSPALWRDRTYYLQLLGRADEANAAAKQAVAIPAASARDHYQLALTHLRKQPAGDPVARLRDVQAALQELNEALRQNDRHYWSLLQRGLCHLELGQADLAAGDFGQCIGLWPELAWGYFNRGIAYERLGRTTEAIAEYTAALQRDPELTLAYRNRGHARLELRQNEDALADLDRAIERSPDEAALHLGRGVALERLGRPAEADAAFEQAWARCKGVPEGVRLQLRWVYGFAVAARLPAQARQAFQEVVAHDPRQVQAWYGLAMLAAEAGRLNEAINYFDRALEVAPHYVEAMRFRAVLQARCGAVGAAQRDINECLRMKPNEGITLYAAACVAALVAKHTKSLEAKQQALEYLGRAFEVGYGRDRAGTDSDLEALQNDPEFKRLLGQ